MRVKGCEGRSRWSPGGHTATSVTPLREDVGFTDRISAYEWEALDVSHTTNKCRLCGVFVVSGSPGFTPKYDNIPITPGFDSLRKAIPEVLSVVPSSRPCDVGWISTWLLQGRGCC